MKKLPAKFTLLEQVTLTGRSYSASSSRSVKATD